MSDIIDTSVPKKSKKKAATYEQYIAAIKAELGEDLRRDICSGDLHHKMKNNKWVPVLSEYTLGKLRSLCRESKGFYSHTAIEDHILHHTYEQPGKLLCDIPDWDGGKRLDAIGACLHPINIEQHHATEILKEWGANMFRRLFNPMVQNTILIFKGPQHCGKDFLIQQMLGDLGEYFTPWVQFGQEKDTFDLLASSLVIWIAEYDRTVRADVASLKNYITMNKVKYRSSYARKAEVRTVRSSFIASCNIGSILRDETGNRRYQIFDLRKIDWKYPLNESAQILAEWKALAQNNYYASQEAHQVMSEYIASQTPSDPEMDLIEDFQNLWADKFPASPILPNENLRDFWRELARSSDMQLRTIKIILKRHGYGGHLNCGTVYSNERNLWKEFNIRSEF